MVVQLFLSGAAQALRGYKSLINRNYTSMMDAAADHDEFWALLDTQTGEVDGVIQTPTDEEMEDDGYYGHIINYKGMEMRVDVMMLNTHIFPVSSYAISSANDNINTAEELRQVVIDQYNDFRAYLAAIKMAGDEFKINPVAIIANITCSEFHGISVNDGRRMYIADYKTYGRIHRVYDMRLVGEEDCEEYDIAKDVVVIPPTDKFLARFGYDLDLNPRSWSHPFPGDTWQPRGDYKEPRTDIEDALGKHEDWADIYVRGVDRLNLNYIYNLGDMESYAKLENRLERLEHLVELGAPMSIIEDEIHLIQKVS